MAPPARTLSPWRTAQAAFANAISMLNTQSGDRYLFSGRATDRPATVPANDMLYGIGASYRYSGTWSVRLDYQHFDGLGDSNTTGETNVDRIAASWVYTFR